MAITDLTNTTWVFNDTVDITVSYYWAVNFTTAGSSTKFNALVIRLSRPNALQYLSGDSNYVTVFTNGTWANEGYKTIAIAGGTDVTNTDLISWLQSNATLQVTDIVVNSTTLETTLHTAGKYCDKNILVKSSDSNLTAENIKKDVSIFGVTGTYEGKQVGAGTYESGLKINLGTTADFDFDDSKHKSIYNLIYSGMCSGITLTIDNGSGTDISMPLEFDGSSVYTTVSGLNSSLMTYTDGTAYYYFIVKSITIESVGSDYEQEDFGKIVGYELPLCFWGA